MPDIISLGNFNAQTEGRKSLPRAEEYHAIAIGPKSLGDSVLIDGRVLRAGQVMPIDGARGVPFDQFRGYRTGTGYNPYLATNEVIDHVEILAWKHGEVPVSFGRSPVVAYLSRAYSDETAAAAVALRIPFQGHRMAKIAVWGVPGAGALTATFTVYGVMYRPRPMIAAASDDTLYSLAQAAQAVPGAVGAGNALASGIAPTVGYIGGTDNAELWDELEVWVDPGGVAGVLTVNIIAEAWGENYDGGGT